MKMKKSTVLALAVLFILPMAYAASINDTIIRASTLLTNLTFNETRYYNTLTVEATGIYFAGYRPTDGASEMLTFNITDSGEWFYVNTTHEDLPHITSSTVSQKVINSGVGTLDVIVVLDVTSCNARDDVGDLSTITCDTCTVSSFVCNGAGTQALTYLTGVTTGNNVLTLNYFTAYERTCDSSMLSLYTLAQKIKLIAAVFGALITIALIYGIYTGRWLDDKYFISIIVVTIILMFITLILALGGSVIDAIECA
jgi:hypothetical protein